MSIVETPAGSGVPADVDDDVADIAGLLNAQHARLVRVIADALAAGSWRGDRIHTPVQWLGLRAGLAPARAKQIIAIAERATDFPKLMAAFDAGVFTLDQVSIVMTAPAWADDHVLEFAQVATLSQLRRTMRDEFFDDGTTANEPVTSAADRLSFGVTSSGDRWRINGELTIADGRRVEAALTEARDSLFDGGDTATWPDALVEVAERSLDAVSSDARRDRYRTWLHLDVSTGVATTTDGWRLPDAIADRILCDGALQPIWERDGVPFNAGRTRRIVSDRLRRLVERRDQGCRVPGCTNRRFVEVHHITAWAAGGRTDTTNLVCLCPKHHRAHHHGAFTISGDPDSGTLVFADASGQPIGRRKLRPAPGRNHHQPARRYEGPTGEPMNWRWFSGWVHPDELARRRAANRRRPRGDATAE